MNPLIIGSSETDTHGLTASLQLLARAEKAEAELATLRALCVRQTDALKGASFLGYLCDDGGKAIPRDSVEYKDIHDGIQKALKLTPTDLRDCVTVKREEWEQKESAIHNLAYELSKETTDTLRAQLATLTTELAEERENLSVLIGHPDHQENRIAALTDPLTGIEAFKARAVFEGNRADRLTEELRVANLRIADAEKAAREPYERKFGNHDRFLVGLDNMGTCFWSREESNPTFGSFMWRARDHLAQKLDELAALSQQNTELVAALEPFCAAAEKLFDLAGILDREPSETVYMAVRCGNMVRARKALASRGEQAKAAEGGKL